jgi:rRNA-processing protein FCF1
MPDALILSSAMASGADLLVTNDRSLAAAAQRLGIGSCLLGDLRSASSSPQDTGVATTGPRE